MASMRRSRRIPGVFLLGLLALLAIVIGVLPGACSYREHDEVVLCFTPGTVSLVVDDSLTLVATLKTEENEDRKLNEESGWRWVSDSDDGGDVEFSEEDLEWTAQGGDIYLAQVVCTAMRAGAVTVTIDQPANQPEFKIAGEYNCSESCIITIASFLPW